MSGLVFARHPATNIQVGTRLEQHGLVIKKEKSIIVLPRTTHFIYIIHVVIELS
jgi:hypothetical protein